MKMPWVFLDKCYQEIFLFSIGIFIKLFIIHYFMGLGHNLLSITLANFFVVIGLFCLVSLVNEYKRIKIYFISNIALSLIFFIDAMYYSHFFTLIPVHSIYQLGQVGSVSGSIMALIKPWYFLLFIDSFYLWHYYKGRHGRASRVKGINYGSKKPILIAIIVLMFFSVSAITYQTGKLTEGYFTPHNLGIINYHVYDLINFFSKITLTPETVSEIAEVMASENINNLGYGLAANKNVIVIQAESVQSFVIDKEIEGQIITPELNKLIANNSTYFSRFYEQVGWGNTSDAEFISHNGLYPSLKTFSYKAYEKNDFLSLPWLLRERGYATIAFHGNNRNFWNRNNIYSSQGLDIFISIEDFEQDEIIGMGISDGSLFKQSLGYLKELPQPFYAFYITLTSHHPFTMDDYYKGLNLTGPFKDTLLENYLQSVHYLDRQIGNFIEDLKQEGLYDNTIIVIYGDHQGLDMRNEEANQLLTAFLEKEYREDEMFRVPLIIHMADNPLPQKINIAGGQIDFSPTLGNLLGIPINSNSTFGKDLLNIEEGFVAKQIHVARGSFIDNEKIFIMSNDGVFENSKAWNIHTGQGIDLELCREGYVRALAEIYISEYILQNNLILEVKEKGIEYIIDYLP